MRQSRRFEFRDEFPLPQELTYDEQVGALQAFNALYKRIATHPRAEKVELMGDAREEGEEQFILTTHGVLSSIRAQAVQAEYEGERRGVTAFIDVNALDWMSRVPFGRGLLYCRYDDGQVRRIDYDTEHEGDGKQARGVRRYQLGELKENLPPEAFEEAAIERLHAIINWERLDAERREGKNDRQVHPREIRGLAKALGIRLPDDLSRES